MNSRTFATLHRELAKTIRVMICQWAVILPVILLRRSAEHTMPKPNACTQQLQASPVTRCVAIRFGQSSNRTIAIAWCNATIKRNARNSGESCSMRSGRRIRSGTDRDCTCMSRPLLWLTAVSRIMLPVMVPLTVATWSAWIDASWLCGTRFAVSVRSGIVHIRLTDPLRGQTMPLMIEMTWNDYPFSTASRLTRNGCDISLLHVAAILVGIQMIALVLRRYRAVQQSEPSLS